MLYKINKEGTYHCNYINMQQQLLIVSQEVDEYQRKMFASYIN